jgi:hypothetical protein
MSIIQGTSKASSGSYQIDQSIRFNFADAPSLKRTPGTASNQKTWTWSAWVKRSGLGNPGGPNSAHQLFGVGAGSCLRFVSTDALRLESPGGNHTFITIPLFRDTSAWYHIVLAFDSTQAVDTDRRKLYVNGSHVDSFSSTTFTGLAQNVDWGINSTSEHQIGKSNLADHFGGYMADIVLIDGLALGPDSFGETNANGVWVPIDVSSLTFGTNGYFIDGRDSTDLGDDESGNGNDYTSSGLTTTDQMLDTPTVNYSTMSPINTSATSPTFTDGNLHVVTAGGAISQCGGTMFVSSGKWGFEYTKTTGSASEMVGIMADTAVQTDYLHNQSDAFFYYTLNGNAYTAGSGSAFGSALVVSDTLEFLLDLDAGTLDIKKNGTLIGTAFSGLSGAFAAAFDSNSTAGSGGSFDFGQGGYTPSEAGYKTWSTNNLPEPTIKDGSAYFAPLTYAGNSTDSHAITGLDFTPDFVWAKDRTSANPNSLFDVIRGVLVRGRSDFTNGDRTDIDTLISFDSGGFTLDDDVSNTLINTSSKNYVAWCWKAGGEGSSNTDGSTTSTVSSNPTAGFSIVTYTGTGANATVGHGLGVAPKMVLLKERSADGDDWYVYHMGLTSASYSLHLNTNAAQSGPSAAYWNSTAPTSSVFSLGTSVGVNQNTVTYVAYCFADVEGFSKMGVYTGNGSANGPMVNCGFRPAYIMIKRVSGGVPGAWSIYDTARMYKGNGPGVTDQELTADTAAAEPVSTLLIDILSNGFKPRTAIQAVNVSATPLIYMAFAEHPFGGENTSPATAR